MKLFSLYIFGLTFLFTQSFSQEKEANTMPYDRLLMILNDSLTIEKLIRAGDSLSEQKGKNDIALFLYKRALNDFTNKRFTKEAITISLKMAGIYEKEGKFSTANGMYLTVLNQYSTTIDLKQKAELYSKLGFNYHKLSQYQASSQAYHKSLKIYLQIKHSYGIGRTYGALALLYQEVKDVRKSEVFFNKSESVFINNSFVQDYSNLLYNKSIICSDNGNLVHAKQLLQKSINIDRKLKTKESSENFITSYFVLSGLYLQSKNYDSSMYYLNLGKHIADSLNLFQKYFTAYHDCLGYYYDQTNQRKKAINIYKKAIKSYNNEPNGNVKYLYENIASNFESLQQYDSALYYIKRAANIQNKLNTQELQQNLSASEEMMELMEQNFISQKKALEADKEKEQLSKKNVLLTFCIDALALLVFLLVVLYRNHHLKLKKEHLSSELEFLRAQLNPHFLFNSINNMYVLIDVDPQKASDMLLKFSDLLRYQLYECSVPEIALTKELDFIENFILFEQMRYGQKIEVSTHISAINAKNFKIAPLILQPFIENAFKHVSKGKQNDNYINISIELKGSQLLFCIENNRNLDEPTSLPGGVGLKNVKKRLVLMYKKLHILETTMTDNKYNIELRLTLNHD